jgi:hypothetical protein
MYSGAMPSEQKKPGNRRSLRRRAVLQARCFEKRGEAVVF